MSNKHGQMSVFEQIKAGLEDSLAYSRGELSLVTTQPPPPPPRLTPKQVAALRRRLKMSQAYFAAVLNVSAKAVQSWEQGIRRPSDAALRILQVIDRRPDVVREIAVARPVRVARGQGANRFGTNGKARQGLKSATTATRPIHIAVSAASRR
jgi:putative transcriptional regulator